MSDDIEERFRQACSAYLAAVEQAEQARACAEAAAENAQLSEQATHGPRDRLLQIVRERDTAAQLGIYGPAGGPVGDGLDDQRRAHYVGTEPVAVLRTVTRPEKTDWWAQHGGMCPECGVSWRKPSPNCPHRVVNWHPAAK